MKVLKVRLRRPRRGQRPHGLARRGHDGRMAMPWYFPTPDAYRARLEAHFPLATRARVSAGPRGLLLATLALFTALGLGNSTQRTRAQPA